MVLNTVVRNTLLGLVTTGTLIGGFASSAPATRQVHLDVHRYCRTVWQPGGQWHGREYTAHGWHHYNSAANRHECHFMYRVLGETTTEHNTSVGIPGIFNTGGRTQVTQPSVSQERRGVEAVYLDKACKEQNGNHRAWARQDRGVVWCNLP